MKLLQKQWMRSLLLIVVLWFLLIGDTISLFFGILTISLTEISILLHYYI